MKRLLIAIIAGCALHAAARADDLTFTWSFTGTTKETPHSVCGSDWLNCTGITHDLSGTFTLAVPDDSHFYSNKIVNGNFGTETIVYQTVSGQLNFYSLEDSFPESSDLTWLSLWLWTGGGVEHSYASDPDGYVTSTTQITYGVGLPPNDPPPPVPEPESSLLLVTGLAVLAVKARSSPTGRILAM